MAATLSDVWKSLYKSAHLIDTVEDEEFLPSSGRNIGLKVNEACQLIFSAELILAQLEEMGIPPGTASTLRIKLNRSILTMCAGQKASFDHSIPSLEKAWEIVDAKSGDFFALGCYAGARLATRSEKILSYFWEFGQVVGRLVQVGDDVKDLWDNEKGKSDIASGHWGLPLSYSINVLPEKDRARLKELLISHPMEQATERTIRDIILSCGAIVYLGMETRRLHARGKSVLYRACPPSVAREELLAILQSAGLPQGIHPELV